MSLWKQVLLCAVVLVLAAGGWYGFQNRERLLGGQAANGPAAAGGSQSGGGGGGGRGLGKTVVVAETVETDIVADDVRAVGTVLVPRSINIYPQVTAMVTDVLFKAGDNVTAGQALVRLDDSDQKVALDLAQVGLDDAQKTLGRSEKLASTNNLTQSALQDARSAVRKAQIALLSAQIALDRRTITAPFAGVVGLSNLSEGDLVTPTTVVATLDDLSVLKVSFLVPERFSGRVADGQTITATADSKPDFPIHGTVTAVDSRVDSTARTLKVEATIDAAAAISVGVKPGMSIKVTLAFPGEKQLAVSALGLQWDRDGSYVWKLDGDTAARAAVTVLERQSGRVLVSSPTLAEGDRIVVEGLQRLRPGSKVAEAGPAREPDGAAGAKPVAANAATGS